MKDGKGGKDGGRATHTHHKVHWQVAAGWKKEKMVGGTVRVGRLDAELIGSLKLGKGWVFVQLIHRLMKTINQLYKNKKIALLETSYQLWLDGTLPYELLRTVPRGIPDYEECTWFFEPLYLCFKHQSQIM